MVRTLHVGSGELEAEPATPPIASPRGTVEEEAKKTAAKEHWVPVSLEQLRAADVGVLLGRAVALQPAASCSPVAPAVAP